MHTEDIKPRLTELEALTRYERDFMIEVDLISHFGKDGVAQVEDADGEHIAWSLYGGRVQIDRSMMPCEGRNESEETTARREDILTAIRNAYEAGRDGIGAGHQKPLTRLSIEIDRRRFEIRDYLGDVACLIDSRPRKRNGKHIVINPNLAGTAEVAREIEALPTPTSSVDPAIDAILDLLSEPHFPARVYLILNDSRATTEPMYLEDREAQAHYLWRRRERGVADRRAGE